MIELLKNCQRKIRIYEDRYPLVPKYKFKNILLTTLNFG